MWFAQVVFLQVSGHLSTTRRTRRGASSGTGRRRAATSARSRARRSTPRRAPGLQGRTRRTQPPAGSSAVIDRDHARLGAGARRVQDDEVGPIEPVERPLHPVALDGDVRQVEEVGCRVVRGDSVRLDCDDARRTARRRRPARRRRARPRSRGRPRAPRGRGASASRTAPTNVSAAPGCTCQKPEPVTCQSRSAARSCSRSGPSANVASSLVVTSRSCCPVAETIASTDEASCHSASSTGGRSG